MEVVQALRTHYLTDDCYKDEHLLSLRVVGKNGATLIGRSWGKVTDMFAVAQFLAQLLGAGCLVSADLRADRLGVRPVMLTFDVDSADSSKEPPVGRLLGLFHDVLGDVLRGEDSALSCSRNVLVTQNVSKPGSLHLYYYNIYATLDQVRTVARFVKEVLGETLESLGLKLDLQPYVMGVLRWPHTYSFTAFPGQPDTRHLEIGFFDNGAKLTHIKVQKNSPFVNCFDVDLDIVPAMLPQFWCLLHAEPTHRTVGPAPQKLARAISSVVEAEEESSEGEEFDEFVPVPIDMMDTATFFDFDELRRLVRQHGKSQEVFTWLARRVVMVGDRFYFKTRGPHGLVVVEKVFTQVASGCWNVSFVERRGKKKIKTSVWAWYREVCRCYSADSCVPYFPGQQKEELSYIFNTWCGFVGYEYLQHEDFSLIGIHEFTEDFDFSFFMWFVHQVICNKSTAIFYRLLAWVRLIFTQPEVPVGIIPVMIGPGGLGKSLWIQFLQGYVFGDAHSAILEKADTLAQRFNGFSDRLSVCFIDEATALSDAALNALKFTATSAGNRPIERKGKEVAFSGMPLSLSLAANANETALKVHERRILGVGCDPKYGCELRNREQEATVMLWKDIMTSPSRCRALAKLFVCFTVRFLDLREFTETRNDPLYTPVYVTMRKNGHTQFEQFWEECITNLANAKNSVPYDGSISTKIVWDGSWARAIPFESVKQLWFEFIGINRGSNKKSQTLRENLIKIAQAKFEVKDGTLWVAFPSNHRCKELFLEYCVIGVDDAALKYEDHSGAWRWNVDGLEPTDDAAFFAWFSFVTEPSVADRAGEREERPGSDADSVGGSSSSDDSGFEY